MPRPFNPDEENLIDDVIAPILERFGGRVAVVRNALEVEPGAWIEDRAITRDEEPKRRRRFKVIGPCRVVELRDESMEVWGQGRGKRRVHPWQIVDVDGLPIGVGLFETRQAAEAWMATMR